jgi:hypothetical protein
MRSFFTQTTKPNQKTMPQITQHMVTSREQTPVFARDDLIEVKANLPKGNWLGILERKLGKLRVISSKGEGWIKSDDAIKANAYDLRVIRDLAGQINYCL